MTARVTIRIQEADFDVANEIAALTQGRTDIGAVVSFSGICRGSEGSETVAALTLEHYPEMAEAEIARHAETAMSRWPLSGLTVVHRVGRIAAGENIVLVLTASQHRQRRFRPWVLMDCRRPTPFWKRGKYGRNRLGRCAPLRPCRRRAWANPMARRAKALAGATAPYRIFKAAIR
jgi:molybdopterin synthase catalytic subunit